MHRLGIQYSYTLEASFGGSTIGNRAGTHLGICDLENMGKEGDFYSKLSYRIAYIYCIGATRPIFDWPRLSQLGFDWWTDYGRAPSGRHHFESPS